LGLGYGLDLVKNKKRASQDAELPWEKAHLGNGEEFCWEMRWKKGSEARPWKATSVQCNQRWSFIPQ
jgi:hypothetical protein